MIRWRSWPLFLLPLSLFLAAFTYLPALYNLLEGLPYLQLVLRDAGTWKSLSVTMLYLLISVPASVSLGLATALLTSGASPGRVLARVIFFHPVILPMVAFASIWLYLLNPTSGPLTELLRRSGLLQASPIADPNYTLATLALVSALKDFGLYMLFFLAGLQSIPHELYEAAAIDGASSWAIFRRVTWPLLSPTTFFVVIYAVVTTLRNVDHIWVLTPYGGVAGEAEVLLYRIYLTAFLYSNLPVASALSLVLALLFTIAALVGIPKLERGVYYEDR